MTVGMPTGIEPGHALVWGGTGQIGQAVIPRLLAAGWQVTAFSRQVRANPAAGLRWLRGEYADTRWTTPVDCLLSLGPLDGFAQWYAANPMPCPRVIAFGSTSAQTKQASSDPHEQDLVRRLQSAEQLVFETAQTRQAAATLLRPTLVYGAGRDQTLSRVAALATRTGVFVLPRGASGLRQPVHVDDLADATLAAMDSPASAGRSYALPGGETLAYREMVARTLACLQPAARLLEVPAPLFGAAVRLARSAGRLQGLNEAAITRMREDLVFAADDARRDLGYAPRPFQPRPAMFGR